MGRDNGSDETMAGDSGAGDSGTGDTRGGRSRAGHSRAGETRSGQTRSGQTRSGQTRSGQTRSGQTRSGQTRSGQTRGNTESLADTIAGAPSASRAGKEPALVITIDKAKDELSDHAGFHSLGGHEMGADILDPESGTARYAERKSAARTIKKQLKTTFGQLLMWVCIATVACGALVIGLSSQHWPTAGVAFVFALPSALILRKKYLKWKKNRSYLIRLCESLGEPVELV